MNAVENQIEFCKKGQRKNSR